MAHYKFDLVQETSTSTGATTMALAGAVTRRRRFGDVLANADTCYVFIEHATAAEWQICLATWNTGHSLTLGAVLASSTGVAVTFSAGTKTISIVAPAAKSVVENNNGDVSITRDAAIGRNATVAGTLGVTGTTSLGVTNPNADLTRLLGNSAARWSQVWSGLFSAKQDSASQIILDRDNASLRTITISLRKQGVTKWSFGCDLLGADAQDFYIYDNQAPATRWVIDSSGHVLPGGDNTQNLGSGSKRYAVVYAGTGTINTSGRDAKRSIGEASEAEKRAAIAIRARVRRYKMADAIDAKGEGRARWHFGYVAEDVRDALAAEGLDPWSYAFLCSDPITKTETYTAPATRPKIRKVAAVESAVEIIDGKPVMVAKQVERDEPVGMMVAVVDEAGQPVMQQTGADEETGEPIMSPMMHFVPEMEEYQVERTREVDTGEARLGLRYSELEAFLRSAD